MANYTNYVLSNPDLRENVEALGLTPSEVAEWGAWHFEAHGKNEGRQNTPDEVTNTAGYTETLSKKHYQDRNVEEVLQASVRSAYKGADAEDTEMWEAREQIADEWNLSNYIAENWNMDPDVGYSQGILGNNIQVNADIGQLVPTPSGDELFIQDRYTDDYRASDFPTSWVTDDLWTDDAPSQLSNFWDVLKTAYRDDSGLLRRVEPYDKDTAGGNGDNGNGDNGNGDNGNGDNGNGNGNGNGNDVTYPESAVGSMNLLSIRPASQKYRDEYMPKPLHKTLLDPGLPGKAGAGMAYMPGEHRDPKHWQDWVLGGHTGQPPGGIWVGSDKNYNIRINPATGQPYKTGEKGPHARWNFTSPAFATSIQDTAWKPSWSNITAKQGADWMDFYENLGGTPEIDTSIKSLLGV